VIDVGSERDPVEELAEEFAARYRQGEHPSVEEYTEKYPELAERIRNLFPVLIAMEQVRSMAGSATGPSEPQAGGSRVAPEQLGDFRILREVGRGGMGVVYEAVQISLGRRVALKMLPFAAAMDPKQLQRFKNEAQAAAHLQHTNIVPVHYVGCERGVHFYAMQYIEGQTLAALIQELRHLAGMETERPAGAAESASVLASELALGRWAPAKPRGGKQVGAGGTEEPTGPYLPATRPPSDGITPVTAISSERSTKHSAFFHSVAHLGLQAAEALEYAHLTGVIHRDIKPANLLIDAGGHLWVTDFGLAKVGSEAGLTLTGDLVGTLRYMSPEQALAKRVSVDARTDVYSLGVTLYELLTLEHAYNGRNREEVLRQIAFEEPRLPRRLNKAVPAELEIIVLKAMAKNPEERYATAQELADDLRRYLEDKPIKAKRPTLRQRAAKWARRHKTVVRAAMLLVVVALLGSAMAMVLIMQERDVAQANYKRAEQILNTAYRSLDKMYLAWAEKSLPQVKELTADDRQFLEDALAFYVEFADQNSSEPKGRHKAAEAYLRVAAIQSQLGQDAEAKGIYRQALEALRRLAAEFPNDPDYRCSLGRCLTDMADMTFHPLYFDTTEENEEAFRNAIQLQERLVAEHPTRTDYQRDLAESYSRVGMHLHRFYKRDGEAEKLCRSARTIFARVVEEHPTVVTYRQFYCDLLGKLAWIWMETGRMQEAGQLFHESLDLRKKLVHDFPGLPYPRLCLGWGYENLAQWQMRNHRLEEAAQTCRQGLDVRAKLAADFAGVRVYREHLAVSYRDLAWVLSQMRRVNEAEQSYREAVALWEVLARDNPGVLNDAVDLGCTKCNLGHLARDRGQLQAALAWYDQAISTANKICAKEPLPSVTRSLLPDARGGRAAALIGLSRLKEAEQAFKELEQPYREMLALDSADHGHWFQDAALRLQMGDLEGYRRVCQEMLARFGHTDDPVIADGTAKTCLLVPDEVHDLGPVLQLVNLAFTGTEHDPYYCWHLLLKGMAEYRAGHFADAIDRLNQALILGRERRYFNSRSLSGTAHALLAMGYHRLGRIAEARQALDQATALLEQPHSKIGSNWSIDLNWDDWLRFYLIRQEAKRLLNGEVSP
jgi:serine/threonine protein kinase/Flp pilus assembly protein TadD